MFELNAQIKSAAGNCQDRIAWIRLGDRLVVMLADGEGNKADAGFAAEFAIKGAMKYVGRETSPLKPEQWLNIVSEIDGPLSLEPSGETALVVADIGRGQISGASVGGSKVFVVASQLTDLTANQQRKPLLGSGEAVTRAYEAEWTDGVVLVCSDGLHKYAARDKLVASAPLLDAGAMIEHARLPNGTLFDDASCLLLRRGKGATGPLAEGTIQHVQPA